MNNNPQNIEELEDDDIVTLLNSDGEEVDFAVAKC